MRYVILIVLFTLYYNTVLSTRLNAHVSHYEPLNYRTTDFMWRHHVTRKSMLSREFTLPLQFQAFGENFDLELTSSNYEHVFHNEMRIVNDHGDDIAFDRSGLYVGKSLSDSTMEVYGHVYYEVFSGILIGQDEVYVIEPAHLHFDDEQLSFHSVIYKESDVNMTETSFCGKNNNGDLIKTPVSKASSLRDLLNLKPSKLRRGKRAISSNQRVCAFQVDVENKFVESVASTAMFTPQQQSALAMGQLAVFFTIVTAIYNRTDVLVYTDTYGPAVLVQDVTVHLEVEPLFSSNFIGVESYLNMHSETNHDSFCLSYRFTSRDFNGGVLGLAFVGKVGAAGGICDTFRTYTSGSMGLNTGIVTNFNYGVIVPITVTALTLAHEIGHNMGSEHDTEARCIDQPGGNYIMYPHASSGDDPNNDEFSICSREMMRDVILARGIGTSGCFREFTGGVGFCGNGIIEGNEECDCGPEVNCMSNANLCCNPTNCTLYPNIQCDPGQGTCCNSTCQFVDTSLQCAVETECAFAINCSGSSSQCPTPAPKAQFLPCNNNQSACFNGSCDGSYCLLIKQTECDCKFTDPARLCEVCCTNNTSDQAQCQSTFDQAKTNLTIEGRYLVIGALCNNTVGYCDTRNICRTINDEGPLTRLTNLLFNPVLFQTISEIAINYWWAILLGALAFLMILVFITWLCSVVKIPNPFKKKENLDEKNPLKKKKNTDVAMQNQHSF